MEKPVITVEGAVRVAVAPINSLGELVSAGGKVVTLTDETPMKSITRLTTAVGDLANSLGESKECPADEVADILLGACGIYAACGGDPGDLEMALRDRLTEKVSSELSRQFQETIIARGGFRLN